MALRLFAKSAQDNGYSVAMSFLDIKSAYYKVCRELAVGFTGQDHQNQCEASTPVFGQKLQGLKRVTRRGLWFGHQICGLVGKTKLKLRLFHDPKWLGKFGGSANFPG